MSGYMHIKWRMATKIQRKKMKRIKQNKTPRINPLCVRFHRRNSTQSLLFHSTEISGVILYQIIAE